MHHSPFPALLVCALAGLALLVAAPAASAVSRLPGTPTSVFEPLGGSSGAHTAYTLAGRRWPGRPARITYHNYAKGYARWVNDAVKAWNTSGAKVRFVATSKRRAKVTIKYATPGCHGFAQVGYSGRRARVVLGRGCNRPGMGSIATHELGHIMGLEHEDRLCANMNSVVGLKCAAPPPTKPWQYRCRLLEADDIKGAVKRYGGSVKPRGPEFCDQYPALGPPIGLTLALETTPDGPGVRLSWRNVTSKFLQRVVIARRRDVCPTGPADPQATEVYTGGEVKSGELASETDVSLSESGRYCYVTFSVDEFNRPGPASSPAWFEHTAPAYEEPPPEECFEEEPTAC